MTWAKVPWIDIAGCVEKEEACGAGDPTEDKG